MAKKDNAVKKAAAAVAAKHASGRGTEKETTSKDTTKKEVAKKEVSKKETVKKSTAVASNLAHSFTDVANAVDVTYKNYLKTLTPRLKLIDIFLTFLVALGILQFVYVILIGNFPFNAFLGGFIACVGQFVLTVSLRMQYASVDTKESKEDTTGEKTFATISPERALGDFIFASLILHFIVFHFIN